MTGVAQACQHLLTIDYLFICFPVSQRIWTPRGYGPPFADLDPSTNFPFKHPLYHIWQLILFSSFFVDVLFNHNTTFLNKGKKNNISHFVPILPHLL